MLDLSGDKAPSIEMRHKASSSAVVRPTLSVDYDERQGRWCVSASGLAPELGISGCTVASAVLSVTVIISQHSTGHDLPAVSGRYESSGERLRFFPHFPFRPGLQYRATLDTRALGRSGPSSMQAHEFSIGRRPVTAAPRVLAIFPSGDVLPENLLRFYIRFTTPMRRGFSERNIELVGVDGSRVDDALYRPPIELWDVSMTCLTVLLDPGRLKRGVGPNRVLGSPLKNGRKYALRVLDGMTDMHGQQLHDGFSKPFSVCDPVRETFGIERWSIIAPAPNTREPLQVDLCRPLDWGQLWRGITVTTDFGRALDGSVDIDRMETLWRFTPRAPWRSDRYGIRVSPALEDVCGNTADRPFDGPLRSESEVAGATASRSVAFTL